MIDCNISLDRLEIYLLDLPQKSVFQSGIGTRKSKETLIIKWVDLDGRIGYGECSCRPDPYFSAEFILAAKKLIELFIVPKLKREQAYQDILNVLDGIRGWNFTKSAIESAVFQIAQQFVSDFSLTNHLHSEPATQVPIGISLGIYKELSEFKDIINQAVEEGYQRVKFKIAPFADPKLFDQINPILFDNDVYVSFDANGSFKDSNLEVLSYFANTYQTTIEQPTPPHRFDLLLQAKKQIPNLKVCFDEEVENIGDLIKAHQLNAIDELNLKIGRVGGIQSSIRILNYCLDNGLTCWMGGMFETGVGRLQNLQIAPYMSAAKAHDLSPSSRYFKEDIIAPEIQMKNGWIQLSDIQDCIVLQEKIDFYTKDKLEFKF